MLYLGYGFSATAFPLQQTKLYLTVADGYEAGFQGYIVRVSNYYMAEPQPEPQPEPEGEKYIYFQE